jgi:flagellar protein FlaF
MSTTTKEQYGAYAANVPAPTDDLDGRDIDRRALMNCASRLNVALSDGGKDMKEYADALRHNQKLWTIFQVALCDQENPLPRDLKMTLLSLSRYVDKVSFRALMEFSPQLLNSLIDINKTIAVGLAKKQSTTAYPASRATASQPLTPPNVSPGVTSTLNTSA